MMITRAVVPTLFTVLNMFCGFLSLVQSSDGKFVEASYFILLAGVFDGLDGLMARLTKSSSPFGVQIDSLSDVVSFGAAPAFLVYKIGLYQLNAVGIIVSSLLVILGGIRLARFNVQLVGFDKEYFAGLPIPASAAAIVSYVLTFIDDERTLGETAQSFLPFLVAIVSLLMVSTIKYDTLPKFSGKEFRKHPVKSISFFFAVLLILFTKGAAIFYLIALFILIGIMRHIFGWFRHQSNDGQEHDAEEAPSFDI
jgi:CDP-diacylglycerol--serine O-phosphatidyltransferase